ncbi:replication factor RFC1 C terminal domain-containing protein [Flagelloscypha sp. PMI_526]|nr:replication factor RFC1 C terminal domain-containing protein [Flagelloscypha sp. PMI_526]
MPPKSPTNTAGKGKDIRNFFGGGVKLQTKAAAKSSSSQPILKKSSSVSEISTKATSSSQPIIKNQPVIDVDNSDDASPVATKPKASGKNIAARTSDVMNVDLSSDESPSKTNLAKTGTKRKSNAIVLSSDDEDEEEEVKPAKKKAKQDKPKGKEPVKPVIVKPKYASAPANPGAKSFPDAEEGCFENLTFVFTGELSSFSRDEAIDQTKRLGGRVTGSPSSKTSYVVVGEGAGAAKLKALEKHNIKTLDEDAWLSLMATRKGGSGADKKAKERKEKEEKEIRKKVKEMEVEEKKTQSTVTDPSTQLWTSRYAPTTLKDICGNKSNVEKISDWLDNWQKNYKSSFKKLGKNMTGTHRALLIHGPPGIGKTTSAHLCAKAAGYVPIEMNASDTRSKKLIEGGMNVGNKVLDGWMGAKNQDKNDDTRVITDRTCIIMDEVDGMSAGDRGGVGALAKMIRTTKVPIICIANDGKAQKLKPLFGQGVCFGMSFARPQANQIRSRIMTVIFKEKMKIPANVVDSLIQGAQSDIRLVLNMLSTWKLGHTTMDYDEGKQLTMANSKHPILTPFDITSKVLGPYMFSHTNRDTLGDKMELYFMDHSFVPLFIQENYLKTVPARAKGYAGPEQELTTWSLLDKASHSISDGDLVDKLIHGPDQQWSLMPLHAICSTIRPASYIYGTTAQPANGGNPYGYGAAFPQFLGQNSKQSKLQRALADVQVRMRLKASGDKEEVRQYYLPRLHERLVQPLQDEGKEGIPAVIDTMDEYYLSKDDWDTIIELGVGDMNEKAVLAGIQPATKTAFTKQYNAAEHPIAYHKGNEFGFGKGKKILGGGPPPDTEDAFEMDEEPVVDEEEEEEEETPKAKGKGKGKKGDELDKLVKVKPEKKGKGSGKK